MRIVNWMMDVWLDEAICKVLVILSVCFITDISIMAIKEMITKSVLDLG